MSQKKKAAPLPDTLRKELRRTIAIYIYSDVVCKKYSVKEFGLRILILSHRKAIICQQRILSMSKRIVVMIRPQKGKENHQIKTTVVAL